MKKLVMGCMSLAMAGMMMVPICAEELSVSYKEPNTYNVVIPASPVSMTKGQTANASITAENVNLEPGAKVVVKISEGANNGVMSLKRENDETTTVQTKISLTENGNTIANDAVVAQFEGNSNDAKNGTGTLYFSAVTGSTRNENIKAGTYTGTLTFSIDAPQEPVKGE